MARRGVVLCCGLWFGVVVAWCCMAWPGVVCVRVWARVSMRARASLSVRGTLRHQAAKLNCALPWFARRKWSHFAAPNWGPCAVPLVAHARLLSMV